MKKDNKKKDPEIIKFIKRTMKNMKKEDAKLVRVRIK